MPLTPGLQNVNSHSEILKHQDTKVFRARSQLGANISSENCRAEEQGVGI